MTITNFLNKYIKLTSDNIVQLSALSSPFNQLDITASIGANAVPVKATILNANLAGWVIDLTEGVNLANKIYNLKVKNMYSQLEFETIITPIDLGYVAATCSDPANDCTLETFSSYCAPLFKTAIDDFFTTKSIPSNVVVSFVGNVMTVTGLPAPFALTRARYGAQNVEPLLEQPFGYGGVGLPFILTDNTLYIAPSFLLAGDTKVEDGVYSITLKFYKAANAGYVEETMCAFLDNETKCKVATSLALVKDNPSRDDMSLMELHYALSVGSNCGCNCADLNAVYNELQSLLLAISNNLANLSTEDCGC